MNHCLINIIYISPLEIFSQSFSQFKKKKKVSNLAKALARQQLTNSPLTPLHCFKITEAKPLDANLLRLFARSLAPSVCFLYCRHTFSL